MSTIRWLSAAEGPESMPPPSCALAEPNGLLAAGGSLEPEWILAAYRRGIFPWYESGQPILWWSPDPRAVLKPGELHVSRSLRRRLHRGEFRITADRAFDAVLDGCAEPRNYTDSTWITDDMARAYSRLHRLGYAHSFEAWAGDALVGGLYGVAIGRVFFGESMFARRTDASKVAFVHGVRFLAARGYALIDCQVATEHLRRFGATTIPRDEFVGILSVHCPTADPDPDPDWSSAFETPH